MSAERQTRSNVVVLGSMNAQTIPQTASVIVSSVQFIFVLILKRDVTLRPHGTDTNSCNVHMIPSVQLQDLKSAERGQVALHDHCIGIDPPHFAQRLRWTTNILKDLNSTLIVS